MSARQTIFREEHTANFTTIQNETIRDKRLSIAARLLLQHILTLPITWRINAENLADQIGCGRDLIYNCLNELKEYGYLVREIIREGGRFKEWITKIFERPNPHDSNILTISGSTRSGATRSGKTARIENTYSTKNEFEKIHTQSECENFSKKFSESISTQEENSQSHSISLKAEEKPRIEPKNSSEDNHSAAAAPVENSNAQVAVAEWLNNRVFVQWWVRSNERQNFKPTLPPVVAVERAIENNPNLAASMYRTFLLECTQRIENYNLRLERGTVTEDLEEIQSIIPFSSTPLRSMLPASAKSDQDDKSQNSSGGDGFDRFNQALKQTAKSIQEKRQEQRTRKLRFEL